MTAVSIQSLGKVGFTRNGFDTEQERIDHIHLSNGDPNGIVSSGKGSLCMDILGPGLWQNIDGAFLWKKAIGEIGPSNEGVYPFEKVFDKTATRPTVGSPPTPIEEVVNSSDAWEVPSNAFPIFKYKYNRDGAERVKTYVFNLLGKGSYGVGGVITKPENYTLLFSSDPEDKTLYPDNISLDGMGDYFDGALPDFTGLTQEDYNRYVEGQISGILNVINNIGQSVVTLEVLSIQSTPVLSAGLEGCRLYTYQDMNVCTEIFINSEFLNDGLFDPMIVYLNDKEKANTVHCMVTNVKDNTKIFFKISSVVKLGSMYKLILQVDPNLDAETLLLQNTSIAVGDDISFQFFPGESGSGTVSYQGVIGYWVDGRPIWRAVIPFNKKTIIEDKFLVHNLGVSLYIKESYLIPGLGRLVPSYQTPGDLLSTGYVGSYVPTENSIKLNFTPSDAYLNYETWYYIAEFVKGDSVIIDTTPPDVPPTLSLGSKTDISVDLNWTSGEDNIAVTNFNVYQDNVLLSNVTSLRTFVTGLTPNTEYEFHITGLDTAGNESNNSNTLRVTTLEATGSSDIIPPTPPILSYSTITEVSVSLTWAGAIDNIAVVGYNIYRDGNLVGSIPGVASEDYLASGLAPNTEYDFYVTAIDAAGNESVPSNTVTVTTSYLDIENPTPPVLSYRPETVTESSVTLIVVGATDNVGVVGYKVFDDNGFVISLSVTPEGYSSPLQMIGLSPSTTYNFYVRAYDVERNESAVSNIEQVVTSGFPVYAPEQHTVGGSSVLEDYDSNTNTGIVLSPAYFTDNYINTAGYTATYVKLISLPSFGTVEFNGTPLVEAKVSLADISSGLLIWYPASGFLPEKSHPYSETLVFNIVDSEGYTSTNSPEVLLSGNDLAKIPDNSVFVGSVAEVITTTFNYKYIPETGSAFLEIAEDIGFTVNFQSVGITLEDSREQGHEWLSCQSYANTPALINDLSLDTEYFVRIKRTATPTYSEVASFVTAKSLLYPVVLDIEPSLAIAGDVMIKVSRTSPTGNYTAEDKWTLINLLEITSPLIAKEITALGGPDYVEYFLGVGNQIFGKSISKVLDFDSPFQINLDTLLDANTEPAFGSDFVLQPLTRSTVMATQEAKEVRGVDWITGVENIAVFYEEGTLTQTAHKFEIQPNPFLSVYTNATVRVKTEGQQGLGNVFQTYHPNIDFLLDTAIVEEWVTDHPDGDFTRIVEVEISQVGQPSILINILPTDNLPFVSGEILT